MKTFIQIATLLGVAWTAAAEDEPCTVSGTGMNCIARGLNAVPAGIWPEISHLYLDTNSISKLYERSFTGFSNVRYLSIADNLLTDVEWAVFADLPHLEFLFLGINKIHEIDPTPLGINLSNLLSITVSSNSITSLDPDALLGAPNLDYFHLYSNPYVVTGTSPILNHPNLRGLDLRYTEAQALGPASFSGLPKLAVVWLSASGITNITGMFAQTPLQHIHLQSNKGITEVLAGSFYPEEVLLSLDLSYSGLEKLEVSAVNGAVKSGATININYTPLARACNYEALYWWAVAKGVTLRADCSCTTCHFARRGAAHVG